MKRRIAFFSPISLEDFESKIQSPAELPRLTPVRQPSKVADVEPVSLNRCLFCHLTFGDDVNELDGITDHMACAHGLFIPNQHLLSDLASFLEYLALQVRVWHECLYCGTTRTSTSAIQSHMKDSSHCMLNFEKEPDLCEFWERSDGAAAFTNPVIKSINAASQELQLLSGKTVSPKKIRRPRTSAAETTILQLASPSATESSQHCVRPRSQACRQLARRDEMGLQNMGSQQRHTLEVAVKRSQKEESMARRAKEWTNARKANDQKHDQNYGALAWAKGGMHNLLPR